MSGQRSRRTNVRAAIATVVGTLTVCTATACSLHPPRPVPTPPVDATAVIWAATLDTVRAALADARPARADSVLSAYRDTHVGSRQAAEALYWRALARVDAADAAGGTHAALSDLDAYRSVPGSAHAVEATTLRRLLLQLDSARAMAAATAVAERNALTARSGMVPRDSLRVRDEELVKVRAEAAAVQFELDRVRRRLAAPGRRR